MQITEIYKSIQGESSYAGLPCVFIRTTGCDLRCVWCDSEFAFYGGTKLTVDEIITEVEKYNCKLVELTGGEPMLQKDIYDLSKKLCDLGYTVLIETGGHRVISKLDQRVIRIMDIKCPGSGESDKNLWSNLDLIRQQDEIKFVIADRRDYDWAVNVIRKHKLEEKAKILISTVFGKLDSQQVVEWMLHDGLKARFQLQMHKYIWESDAREV